MNKLTLTSLSVVLIASLSGCVFVRDRNPDTMTTTSRQTTVSTPAATTVERTTVY